MHDELEFERRVDERTQELSEVNVEAGKIERLDGRGEGVGYGPGRSRGTRRGLPPRPPVAVALAPDRARA